MGTATAISRRCWSWRPRVRISRWSRIRDTSPTGSTRLRIRAARADLRAHRLVHRIDDPVDRWHGEVLERVGRREGDVRGGDPHDWPVELEEDLLADDRTDLRTPAAQPRVLLDGEHASTLGRLAEQRRRVEWHEAAHVDN